MRLQSQREVDNTRRKLRILEDCYTELQNEVGSEDDDIREASMESLARLINQFKEEISRYEALRPGRSAVA